MLEKIGQMAERAATSVSRRQFLGGIGRGAAALAAAVAGVLAVSGAAHGGKPVPWCSHNSAFSCGGALVGAECYSSTEGPGKCTRIRGTQELLLPPERQVIARTAKGWQTKSPATCFH